MSRKMTLVTLAWSLMAPLLSAAAAGQAPPNYGCPGADYQQFKFWVGDWDVVTAVGNNVAGESSIQLLAAGCVIFENWKGSNGGSGHSINVFDQADGKWHQTWVDSTGDQVHYVGSWTGARLDLRAEDLSTPQKTPVVLTMTFEPLSNGDVRQTGTLSTDGGHTFQPAYDLIYKRKARK